MAQRKPKNAPTGIADDIVGGIRKIMSPWLGAPPAQNNKVTQAQGLARTAAQTLDQTFAGGMIGAGVKGNKALAKQAAVNASYLAGGYVAGKAVSKVAGAVVESGLPNRFKNTLLNQSVVVHGTGRPIVGNQIRPTAGSPGSPNEAVVFAWNPKYSPPDQKWIAPAAGEYAGRPYYKGGVEVPGEGNVVVGTVKNKNLAKGEYEGSPLAMSKGPMKINEVVKYNSNTSVYQKALEKALQRQGIRVKPNASEIRASKKLAAELAKRKRNAPPSPV
jgi:hypothetical protein